MAYDRQEIFEKAKEVTETNRLIFIEEIVSYLPCDRSTFYRFFDPECDEYDTLKALLEKNRVELKTGMRKKWYDSENATLQVALMKLICTDEEAHRLNGSVQKVDVTTQGERIDRNPTVIMTVEGIPKSER